ncbi:hypothetical protein [Deinococcus frigens]|uniref:hypothetical protein n=1 Tax=Deinococcus frigens TaxID=249403 RepID=UPI0012EC2D0D
MALAKALDLDIIQILWGKGEPQEVAPMPEGRAVTGNESRVTREHYEVAKQWVAAGRDMTVISDAIGVSRGTLYKAFARFGKQGAPGKSSKGPVHQAAGSKTRTPKAKAAKAVS